MLAMYDPHPGILGECARFGAFRCFSSIGLGIFFSELQDGECLDADASEDRACKIREYFIRDFGHFKDRDALSAVKPETDGRTVGRGVKETAS